jgi:hypothetical protein
MLEAGCPFAYNGYVKICLSEASHRWNLEHSFVSLHQASVPT